MLRDPRAQHFRADAVNNPRDETRQRAQIKEENVKDEGVKEEGVKKESVEEKSVKEEGVKLEDIKEESGVIEHEHNESNITGRE